jgi:hypothetical protein
MRAQRTNREGTIINQDATEFIEAIRSGARGFDDLTNYVYAITNSWGQFNNSGVLTRSGVNGYTFTTASVAPGYYSTAGFPISSATNIIGLMSAPEFTDSSGYPTNNPFSFGFSNHIVAYVRSLSGMAFEKPPQDNQLLRESAFSYRIVCANVPWVADTNQLNSLYSQQLAANLHDLRLTFLWPQLPNGGLGLGHQAFRTLIAGQLITTNYFGQTLYFFQPQTFTQTQ